VATFGLVHGAWHGAWCWERLTPELEARGHRTVAVDLPCEDATATFPDYADVVEHALEGADAVVLVGHSLAGYTIPLVAARRPVSRLVYLCAVVPIPGRSFREQLALEPDSLLPGSEDGVSEPDELERTRWVDEAGARRALYADCDDEDAHAAFARLRWQARRPYSDPFPLAALPSVPTTYIVCRDERTLNPERSRAVARGRLGAELVELPGGHSPFLSRPAELAALLDP
jgi:pimeloyl-ACP methyl ester carboxylesterase